MPTVVDVLAAVVPTGSGYLWPADTAESDAHTPPALVDTPVLAAHVALATGLMRQVHSR